MPLFCRKTAFFRQINHKQLYLLRRVKKFFVKKLDKKLTHLWNINKSGLCSHNTHCTRKNSMPKRVKI